MRELIITIESVYVERTGLYVMLGTARDPEGNVVDARVESGPMNLPTKWAEDEARKRATRDTPALAAQAIGAWIVEVVK